MFDAAAVATGAEVLAQQAAQQQADAALAEAARYASTPGVDASHAARELDASHLQDAVQAAEGFDLAQLADSLSHAWQSMQGPAHRSAEIVFIDAGVEDSATLLQGINPSAEVVLIDNQSDGIAQMADALRGRTDLSAIHIISHGDQGSVQLGSGMLDLQSIATHGKDFDAIRAALSADADILIYGCDVGAGERGQQFASALADATGADVASSVNLTGAASRGGDWTLESRQGLIETQAIAATAWEGTLAKTNTGAWVVAGGTSTNTTDGVTTTVTFTPDAGTAAFTGTTNGALNNIAAFDNNAQGAASLVTTFAWDTTPEASGNAASADAQTGTVTITFSSAITNPVIHLDRLGGSATGTLGTTVQNGAQLTLLTAGATLTRLAGTPHFAVNAGAGTITNSQIGSLAGTGFTAESNLTQTQGTAAGSVQVNGTFTTLTFRIAAAPGSNEGTGGDGFELAVAVDAPPVANADSFSTAEDTPAIIDVRANDTDVRNDALTVTQVNGAAISVGGSGIDVTGGVVTLNAAGNLVFTPRADYSGSTGFSYTVRDANGASSSATVTGTVTPVNDPPVVNLNSNTNLLVDGNFDNTTQPNLNANNLQGTTYGAFTSNASINVIRVDGSAYLPGPDLADSGNQYIDIAADGTLSQAFTLSSTQSITFGAAFANRDLSLGGYVAPTTVVEILNAGGTVVATANALSLTRSNGAESWFATSGTATLAAGTYTYRITLGNFGHVDSVYVRPGPNYATSYTENAAPVSIANAADAVTDRDNTNMTSATIVLTNFQAGDVLSVIGSLPAGITASAYDAGTGTITLSGSATSANYAAAIRSIGFSSTSDNPSITARTVNVTVNDGANNSNTAVTTIAVVRINDAPVAAADSYANNEDNPFSFDPRSNDTDAEGDALTITAINGTTITADSVGVAVTGGVVVRNVNGTLTFVPNLDFSGGSAFTYTVSDGNGATSTGNVAVTVNPVNDAPVVDLNGPTAATTAPVADGLRDASAPSNAWEVLLYGGAFGVAGTAAPNNADRTQAGPAGAPVLRGEIYLGQDGAPLVFRDSEIAAGERAQNVLIRSGNSYGGSYVANGANGDFDPAAGSIFQYVARRTMTSAGILQLGQAGSAIDDFAEIFVNGVRVAQNLAFTYNLGAPLTASFNAGDVVEIRLTNQGGVGAFSVEARIFDLNNAATYTENAAPVPIAAANASVADVDSANLTGATITLANVQTGDVLSVIGSLPAGITPSAYNASTGVLTLSGSASAASYQAAIRQIGFSSTSDNPSTTPRTVNVTVNDGASTSVAAVATVTVVTTEDAPANTVPASQSTPEDTALVFSAANGNAISVADPDSASLTTTLNVTQGLLTLGSVAGVTVTGNGTASVVVTGSGAAITAALSGLRYATSADYNGADTLTISTSDGTVTDVDTIAITVTPVVDITADTVTTAEDTAVSFNVLTGTNGATADSFENAGAVVTSVTQPANGTVSFTAAGVMTFTPAANFNGTTSFTYTVTSGGVTETATVTVNVTGVNDAPVNTVPSARTTAEDTPIVFSAANGNAISITDIDSANATTTLTVLNGTLTLGSTAGVTVSGNGTGTVVLSGTTVAINAALSGLAYNGTADRNGADTLTISTSDGTVTDVDTIAITVTPVVDITADAVTTAEDTAVSFNVLTGTNGATADSFENAGAVVTSVTQPANGTVSFTAAGVMTFTPAANFNGTTSFTYTVTSGGVTETATVTVNVNAVNDAPVNALPAAQTTAEDTPLVFSSANGNAISVSDIDSASASATLAVLHGTLTLGSTAGVTVTGNGTASLVVSGTTAAVNAALAGLTYRNTADYNGADTLSITTSDGILADADTLALTVTPVVDITADTVTTAEDTAVSFNVLTGTNGATADSFENAGAVVTSVTQPANGTVSFTAAGVMTFTPAANFNGTTTFTYTVTSGGVTETATATVNVTAVNDAPTNTVQTPQITPEDSPLLIPGTSVADVDGGLLSTTLTVTNGTLVVATGGGATISGNNSATVTLSGTAAQINAALAGLTYVNTPDYSGPALLTMSTTDGVASDVDTIAITVTPVVDITADTVTTAEDTAVSFNVLTGTNGATADSFENAGAVVTSVTQPANGTVSFTAAGVMTFTPAANFNGTTSFTYTVTSGGVTETATVTVNVTAVDDAPVNTVPGPQTAAEDATLAIPGVSIADIDSGVLTTTLTVTNGTALVTTGGGASISGNGGATVVISGTAAQVNAALVGLRFNATADYNGSAQISISTSDGTVTDVDTIAITVTPVVDITADTVTTAEDTAVSFNVLTGTNGATADSFENAGAAVTSVTQPANGTVSFTAAGVMTFTPAANFNGTTSFTYTVTSGGVTETATVTVNVNAVNDAPVNTIQTPQTVVEDVPLAIPSISVADAENGNLSTTLTVANGTVSVGTVGGAAITGNGTGTVVLGGTAAQINAALAGLVYTNVPDRTGPDALTVTTSDGVASATDVIVINITPVADITNDTVTTAEDTPIAFNVITGTNGATADNFENPGAVLTAVTQPPVGQGSVAFAPNGALIFTPAPNFNGTTSFTYTVTSGGVTETATVTVNVTAVNDAPVNTVPPTVVIAEDTPVAIGGVTVTDAEGNAVSTALTVANGTLTVNLGGGAVITGNGTGSLALTGTAAQVNAALAGLVYASTPDFSGSDTLTMSSSDGQGIGTSTIAITVNPVADVTDDLIVTAENVPVTFNVLTGTGGATPDNFENPGAVIFSVTQPPAGQGSATFNVDGTINYTPPPFFNGLVSFTYTVTSGGVSETGVIRIEVGDVNYAPVVAADNFTTSEDVPVVIDVRANDVDQDGDPFAVTRVNGQPIAVGAPVAVAGGSVSLNGNGTLTFTPVANFNGPVNFTYTVVDSAGAASTGSVSGTIVPVNDAPVASAPPVVTPEGAAFFGRVTASDVDGDALGFAIGVPPSNGSVVLNADGSFAYVPAPGFNGADSFTVQVSDGRGGVTTVVVPVAVVPAPIVPGPLPPLPPPLPPPTPGMPLPPAGGDIPFDAQQLIDMGRAGEPAGWTEDADAGRTPYEVQTMYVPPHIIEAVNGLRPLHGVQTLDTDAPLRTAVYGVRSLNGLSAIDVRTPILDLVEELERRHPVIDSARALFTREGDEDVFHAVHPADAFVIPDVTDNAAAPEVTNRESDGVGTRTAQLMFSEQIALQAAAGSPDAELLFAALRAASEAGTAHVQ